MKLQVESNVSIMAAKQNLGPRKTKITIEDTDAVLSVTLDVTELAAFIAGLQAIQASLEPWS